MRRLIFAIALSLYGCGGGGSGSSNVAPIAQSSPAADAVNWVREDDIAGICCSYAPIVISGYNLRVYSNTVQTVPGGDIGPGDGWYYLRDGTLGAVSDPQVVLKITSPADAYIRTSGVVRDSQGHYSALLYTGSGYPTTNGYSPSWATSNDGLAWTWHGPVSPWSRVQSSANNLVLNEASTDARFSAYVDNVGHHISLMTSADGLHWVADPDEIQPPELAGDDVEFMAATRTPFGVHIIYAVGFPTSVFRHLYSVDGKHFCVIEMNAPLSNYKGVNLDFSDGRVHAIAFEKHWSFLARAFTC